MGIRETSTKDRMKKRKGFRARRWLLGPPGPCAAIQMVSESTASTNSSDLHFLGIKRRQTILRNWHVPGLASVGHTTPKPSPCRRVVAVWAPPDISPELNGASGCDSERRPVVDGPTVAQAQTGTQHVCGTRLEDAATGRDAVLGSFSLRRSEISPPPLAPFLSQQKNLNLLEQL
ncbi:hypothetical protein MRS44_008163 [Fusarium solani]|uniref:uncharacterized protein n=1 Tax=Fusarium solani TaxID=169388 RepID=UPI0032C41195|nr:hypothetical protein MRS44_008163 [Fusarium solani]